MKIQIYYYYVGNCKNVSHNIASWKASIFPISVKEEMRKEFFSVFCSNGQNKGKQRTL